MRKYKIYSGTKPSSVNKTFAVNWGNKYFTVSPIVGKETIPSLSPTALSANGNQLTLTGTNAGKDSMIATPYRFVCSNPDYASGSTQQNFFSSAPAMTLGPNSSFSYQWDVSNSLHPGKNTVNATTKITGVYSYQIGGGVETSTNPLTVYKKFSAPTVSYSVTSFKNTVYNSSSQWTYGMTLCEIEGCNFSVKISNPNASEAACYYSDKKIINQIAANSSAVAYQNQSVADSLLGYIQTPTSHNVSYSNFSLDSASLPSDSRTKSAVTNSSHSFPAPPQLVKCLPISASSNSFQITIKNNNNTLYYCRAMYHSLDGTGSDYWMIKCPAHGTGTMIDANGNTRTFSLTRGSKYDLSFYFYTLDSSSMSYSGTQRSRMIHYPFKTPDSGYSYVSPVVVDRIYDDDTNPTKVTFSIENHNPVALTAQLDLYVGTGTSGTRVDYWKVNVPAMGRATCPNQWSISNGSTYTLAAYFMANNASYHSAAVSGKTQDTFAVIANT